MGLKLQDFGVRAYRQGIDFKLDKRRRDRDGTAFVISARFSYWALMRRGTVSGLSGDSAKRLEFIAANIAKPLGTLLTLTYRENPREGESEQDRNLRVARKTKEDLNRFLSCVRVELGDYLWVQEFQERGVVHYHVLCEKPITEQRVRLVWCRAIGALNDPKALTHAVKVEAVANPLGSRSYLGRYLGKERQKKLPAGVDGAGRWWGRSKGLDLQLESEVISCQFRAQQANGIDLWVSRQVRRYLTRRLGWKFRGGMLVDWGGTLSSAVSRIVVELRQWFMDYVDRETARAVSVAQRHGFEMAEEQPAPDVRDDVTPLAWQLGSDAETLAGAQERVLAREGKRPVIRKRGEDRYGVVVSDDWSPVVPAGAGEARKLGNAAEGDTSFNPDLFDLLAPFKELPPGEDW